MSSEISPTIAASGLTRKYDATIEVGQKCYSTRPRPMHDSEKRNCVFEESCEDSNDGLEAIDHTGHLGVNSGESRLGRDSNCNSENLPVAEKAPISNDVTGHACNSDETRVHASAIDEELGGSITQEEATRLASFQENIIKSGPFVDSLEDSKLDDLKCMQLVQNQLQMSTYLDEQIALALFQEDASQEATNLENTSEPETYHTVESDKKPSADHAAIASRSFDDNAATYLDEQITCTLSREHANKERTDSLSDSMTESLNAVYLLPMSRGTAEDGVALDLLITSQLDEQLAVALAQTEASEEARVSVTCRAWDFVQSVISKHDGVVFPSTEASLCSDENCWKPVETHRASNNVPASSLVELIGTDDMVFMVERMIEAQLSFAAQQKNCHVDIGFHYTNGVNLENIREHGLLTKTDRDQHRVVSNYNGSTYGDGVYTGSNPFAFRRYGELGLIVARLRGESHFFSSSSHYRRQGYEQRPDTVVVRPSSPHEMVVLSRSSQCVPIACFHSASLECASARDALWNSQQLFQKIIDSSFNNGAETMVQTWDCFNFLDLSRGPAHAYASFTTATTSMPVIVPQLGQPSAPDVITIPPKTNVKSEADAVVKRTASWLPQYSWYQSYRGRRLLNNGTQDADLKRAKFITCRQYRTYTRTLDNSAGTKYSNVVETMRVSHFAKEDVSCEGEDTIVIVYTFHTVHNVSGRTNRIAYLPSTSDCSDILLRLKFAFENQLMNAISWPIIPHRNSPYKSYCDFVQECNQALDDLGVPCSHSLRKSDISPTVHRHPSPAVIPADP